MAEAKILSDGEQPAVQPTPPPIADVDPAETREWLDSLQYVLDSKGRERAQFLLSVLQNRAVQEGVELPLQLTTPYINTIPADEQPPYPGNREIERRIKSIIRWNAMAMVVRANKQFRRDWRPHLDVCLGGHAVRSRLQSLLPRSWRDRATTATRSTSRDTPRPGMYARAFLEGRLTEENLDNFRRELQPERRPVVLSAPLADARLLGVSHRLDGPGADHGHLPGAFQSLPGRPRHQEDTSTSASGRFLGDGECDEPETLGAITLAAREQLDNLIFVINCNLQRLDGPVRGNGKIIQELEGIFRGAGWNVIKVIWGDDWDPLLEDDETGLLVKRMGEVVDGQYQKYTVMPGSLHSRALLRQVSGSCWSWSGTTRTRSSSGCGAAVTIPKRSTPPTRRRSTIRASRPSFWPRRSRAMAWAKRAKGATSRTTRRS